MGGGSVAPAPLPRPPHTAREREERAVAGRRRATATSGVRPSLDRGSGGKRGKERRSERLRKRVQGACLAGGGAGATGRSQPRPWTGEERERDRAGVRIRCSVQRLGFRNSAPPPSASTHQNHQPPQPPWPVWVTQLAKELGPLT